MRDVEKPAAHSGTFGFANTQHQSWKTKRAWILPTHTLGRRI